MNAAIRHDVLNEVFLLNGAGQLPLRLGAESPPQTRIIHQVAPATTDPGRSTQADWIGHRRDSISRNNLNSYRTFT